MGQDGRLTRIVLGMAKIVPSDLHPAEEVHYGLGAAAEGFTLAPGESFETDDAELIGNARVHPWLDVEVDPVVVEQPEAAVAIVKPLAIEAGLPQTESHEHDGTFQTIADADKSGVEEVEVPAAEVSLPEFKTDNVYNEGEQH